MANTKNPQLKHEFKILEILNSRDTGGTSTKTIIQV